jgi:hypothetical protein
MAMDTFGLLVVAVGCLLVIVARRRLAVRLVDREAQLRPGLVSNREKHRRVYELGFAGVAALILVVLVVTAIR